MAHVHQLDRDAFEDTFGKLLDDVNGDLRLKVLTDLVIAQPWREEPVISDWLFQPFRKTLHARSFRQSAVVSVCDREYIRDVQAMLTLSRTLSKAHYPKTRFHQIALHNPAWAHVELDTLGAICFVGRPGMFQNCPLLAELSRSANPRFQLPDNSEKWRSKAVTPESSEAFHNVTEHRFGFEPRPYRAEDANHRRRDYAIVQRFRVKHGGRNITVLVLAGATSLATIGAVEWVTSEEFASALTDANSAVLRHGLNRETELEALLEVTATMPDQALPWKVETKSPLKLFLDDNPDALRDPEVMTVHLVDGEVRDVLLDGDSVRFRGPGFQQLLAICAHLPMADPKRLDLRVMQSHPAFRQPDHSASSVEQVEWAIRDNLKKQRLREAITFESGWLIFRCKVEFVS